MRPSSRHAEFRFPMIGETDVRDVRLTLHALNLFHLVLLDGGELCHMSALVDGADRAEGVRLYHF